MDKEKYESTELEIIKYQTEDIITTSGDIPYEDDETSRTYKITFKQTAEEKKTFFFCRF